MLENLMADAVHKATKTLPIEMAPEYKRCHEGKWKIFRERQLRLDTQRGQAFEVIKGQCTTVLMDKMKHESTWNDILKHSDPLTLFSLIEKIVLAQTEDTYPYATVYDM